MATQQLLLLAVLVLLVALTLLTLAYSVLRTEAVELRAHQGILAGLSRVFRDVVTDVRTGWTARVVGDEELEDHLSIGRHVAHCLPILLNSLGARVGSSNGHHVFTADDFAAAGLRDQLQQITDLLAANDRGELNVLWKRRRLIDLVAMLRITQQLHDGLVAKKLAALPQETGHNRLLSLLRDKASADAIRGEIELQIRQLSQATGASDESPERTSALLKAVVDVLCFRRDQRRQALTLGLLVQTLSGRNIEQMYRECLAEEDSSGSGWRPQYKALRAYVDSLPSWDGRLPFHDVTAATHNSVSRVVLAALNRVA